MSTEKFKEILDFKNLPITKEARNCSEQVNVQKLYSLFQKWALKCEGKSYNLDRAHQITSGTFHVLLKDDAVFGNYYLRIGLSYPSDEIEKRLEWVDFIHSSEWQKKNLAFDLKTSMKRVRAKDYILSPKARVLLKVEKSEWNDCVDLLPTTSTIRLFFEERATKIDLSEKRENIALDHVLVYCELVEKATMNLSEYINRLNINKQIDEWNLNYVLDQLFVAYQIYSQCVADHLREGRSGLVPFLTWTSFTFDLKYENCLVYLDDENVDVKKVKICDVDAEEHNIFPKFWFKKNTLATLLETPTGCKILAVSAFLMCVINSYFHLNRASFRRRTRQEGSKESLVASNVKKILEKYFPNKKKREKLLKGVISTLADVFEKDWKPIVSLYLHFNRGDASTFRKAWTFSVTQEGEKSLSTFGETGLSERVWNMRYVVLLLTTILRCGSCHKIPKWTVSFFWKPVWEDLHGPQKIKNLKLNINRDFFNKTNLEDVDQSKTGTLDFNSCKENPINNTTLNC